MLVCRHLKKIAALYSGEGSREQSANISPKWRTEKCSCHFAKTNVFVVVELELTFSCLSVGVTRLAKGKIFLQGRRQFKGEGEKKTRGKACSKNGGREREEEQKRR